MKPLAAAHPFPAPATGLLPQPDHELTVLLPALNEASRLPATMEALAAWLDRWGVDYRVVVIDDGSRDRTRFLANEFGVRFSAICRARQGGKGAAIRTGALHATGRVIAFTDADLPFDLNALRRGYELVASGQCDAALGARDLDGSRQVASRSRLRNLASKVFRGLVRTCVSRNITDTQCGLKVFSRAAAKEIFSRTTLNGFAFDTEVIYLIERLGIPYQRMPVTLINDYGSTLSLGRHALPMLLDVFRMRWRALTGALDCSRPLSPTAYVSPAVRPETTRRAA